jgi:hypothetical protein
MLKVYEINRSGKEGRMPRHRKAYRLWKKGKYWYWCSHEQPRWKSTGETNRDRAEKLVLK